MDTEEQKETEVNLIRDLIARRSPSTVKLAMCDLYLNFLYYPSAGGVERYRVELLRVRPPNIANNKESTNAWAACTFPIELDSGGMIAPRVNIDIVRFVLTAQDQRIAFLKSEDARKAKRK